VYLPGETVADVPNPMAENWPRQHRRSDRGYHQEAGATARRPVILLGWRADCYTAA